MRSFVGQVDTTTPPRNWVARGCGQGLGVWVRAVFMVYFHIVERLVGWVLQLQFLHVGLRAIYCVLSSLF